MKKIFVFVFSIVCFAAAFELCANTSSANGAVVSGNKSVTAVRQVTPAAASKTISPSLKVKKTTLADSEVLEPNGSASSDFSEKAKCGSSAGIVLTVILCICIVAFGAAAAFLLMRAKKAFQEFKTTIDDKHKELKEQIAEIKENVTPKEEDGREVDAVNGEENIEHAIASAAEGMHQWIEYLKDIVENVAKKLDDAKDTIRNQQNQIDGHNKALAKKETEKNNALEDLNKKHDKALTAKKDEIQQLKKEHDKALTAKDGEIDAGKKKLLDAFPVETGKFRNWVENNLGAITPEQNLLIFSLARLEILAADANTAAEAYNELTKVDKILWEYFGKDSSDDYTLLNNLRSELKEPLKQILEKIGYKIEWAARGTNVNGDENYRIIDDSGCVVIVTVTGLIQNGSGDVVQKSKVICGSVE